MQKKNKKSIKSGDLFIIILIIITIINTSIVISQSLLLLPIAIVLFVFFLLRIPSLRIISIISTTSHCYLKCFLVLNLAGSNCIRSLLVVSGPVGTDRDYVANSRKKKAHTYIYIISGSDVEVFVIQNGKETNALLFFLFLFR